MLTNQLDITSICNSRVIVRVAYDISSLDSIFRVRDSIQTIKLLLENNNTLVLLTHWGRPNGVDQTLSIAKQMPAIINLISNECKIGAGNISFINQFEETIDTIASSTRVVSKHVFVLENVRFDEREQSDNEEQRLAMAKEYSVMGDYFVDEAFPLSHRVNSTNVAIREFLPSYFGLSYMKEVKELTFIAHNPSKPFILISGGAKLETKIPLLQKIGYKTDYMIIGGLICFTLLKAKGVDIPGAYFEESQLKNAEKLLKLFGEKIVLPNDFVYSFNSTSNKEEPLDIGVNSLKDFSQIIKKARSVFWNGPLGYYEGGYLDGTVGVAKSIIDNSKCFSVIGGGDIVSCLPDSLSSQFNFVSTGGGATLDFLAKTA